jgi:hypothetical protein
MKEKVCKWRRHLKSRRISSNNSDDDDEKEEEEVCMTLSCEERQFFSCPNERDCPSV